jgi:hypothetical protein
VIILPKYRKVIIDSNKKKIADGRVKLFREIAQRNNVLPFSQIKNKTEYRRIIKLLPRSDLNIPGKTFMYFEDFIEENIEKYDYLKKNLRIIYGRKLSVKNWSQISIVSLAQPTKNRLLLLTDKTKNPLENFLIKIELENGTTKNARLYIKNNEQEFEVPICIDKKNGKTRIRALSYKTYLPLRGYIYTRLNENGDKKKNEILRKKETLISDTSTKNDDLLRVYEDIVQLNFRYLYVDISMNLRALLFYAIHEDDMIQFNKSIECLACLCKDKGKTDDICRYDTDSKSKNVYKTKFQIYSRTEVEDFPFLLPEYINLKHILPVNWTFYVLKKIGNNLRSDLELFSLEQLKYEVIKEFSRHIKEYAQSLEKIGDRKFEKRIELDKDKKFLLKYCRQIRYLIKETPDVINSKTIQNLKRERQRELDFSQELRILLENNDRDVIPIDRMIAESKLNFESVSYILDSIECGFGQRYVVTQTCIISRSKAETLKLSLRCLPLCENASKILEDNGIPRRCLRYIGALDNIVEKLGFYTYRILISSDYLHYIDVVREKIPKELKSPPHFWFLNTRFGRLQPFSNDSHHKYCTITHPIKLYNKQNDNSFTLKAIQESSKIAELRILAKQLIPNND